MNSWPTPDPTTTHPEVTNHAGQPRPVGSHLYLGYGPLNFQNGNTKLKASAAIQADEDAELIVAFPMTTEIAITLQLANWFGTLGGRSRNGWGSLALEGHDIELLTRDHSSLQVITRPLGDCLRLDWPHAIGRDEQGLLIWRTPEYASWQEVMRQLARIKIAFRTALHFDPTRSHRIDQRHVIAYPVTHHNFNPWGNQARLANQLRFKVTKTTQGYVGMAYHLPCSIPNELLNKLNPADRTWITNQQLTVWQTVHGILDQQMQRIS